MLPTPGTRPSIPGGIGSGSGTPLTPGRPGWSNDRPGRPSWDNDRRYHNWRNYMRPNYHHDYYWNRGDRNGLNIIIGDLAPYRNVLYLRPLVPGVTTSALARSMWQRGNYASAAQSLAQAWSSGQGDDAAEALAYAAANADDRWAVGEAAAEAAWSQPSFGPWLLRRSAERAVDSGNVLGFAQSMANAFIFAAQRDYMPRFATAVADAISTGGAPARYAYGEAIATAIAAGDDGQAAVAEATAEAFCAGGATASSWASAYAVALEKDARGCLVLSQARAMAEVKCGASGAQAFSKAQTTSVLLGFCGLLDLVPTGSLNLGWSDASADASTSGATTPYTTTPLAPAPFVTAPAPVIVGATPTLLPGSSTSSANAAASSSVLPDGTSTSDASASSSTATSPDGTITNTYILPPAPTMSDDTTTTTTTTYVVDDTPSLPLPFGITFENGKKDGGQQDKKDGQQKQQGEQKKDGAKKP